MNKILLCIAIAGSLALGGCKPGTDASPASSDTTPAAAPAATPPAEPSTTTQAAPAPASGDGLALGLLGAVDENEIAAAKQAQAKHVTGAVLDYADMMEKEHTENLEKTQGLGTLSDAAEVEAVKNKGVQELATLDQKSGQDYAAAYVDAMISGHQDALSMIDGKMLPAASSASVKQHLTETRTHVEHHLAKAQEIKKTM